ncbi:MAG TPA: hypothetical protein PK517_01855 [Nitrosomonas sp.]|nr:hypothetical protein [Nitrosomonas sp.]
MRVEYKSGLDSNYSSVVGSRNGIEYVVGCTSYIHLNDGYDGARDDGYDVDDLDDVHDDRDDDALYPLALM